MELEIELVGAGGEPVDLRRTLASHGVADLPPNRLDEVAWTLETTLAVDGRARTVRVLDGTPGHARVELLDSRAGASARERVLAGVRHMLRLDEDLSRFYALVAEDEDLAWVTRGAGRMLRSPTVFDDVVKTVCTTNTAWSATIRMVSALVEHLGVEGRHGRAFPSPAAMAEAPEDFYRDVARAGYRGAYLRAIAGSVADGSLDLEELDGRTDLPDDEVAARLLALPGVGPVRRRARDDAARPLRPPHPRFLDASHVRAADEPQGRRRPHDRAALPPLPRLRRAGVLALPDARLGGGLNQLRGASCTRPWSRRGIPWRRSTPPRRCAGPPRRGAGRARAGSRDGAPTRARRARVR
jgi:3-methyladenine DNA glycosylase/8-oxoguanine DNA glycosylase